MNRTRPAAMAGSFYPGESSTLAAEVAGYLGDAAGARSVAPKAIIAPHAGYMYSGAVAGSIYARLAPLAGIVTRVVLAGPAHRVYVTGAAIPSVDAFASPLAGIVTRVVLAGPAHRVYVTGAAIPSVDAFASPLGDVALDAGALATLRALPFVEVNDAAHAREHSLEVHLPFLQSVLGRFSLVPIVVGDASPDEMASIFDALWGGPETLIVVSSDLSHYLPYDSARGQDSDTARAILALEASLVPDEACGAAPINGLLRAARRRNLKAELVDLRNSGDTAGSRDRVVGYGAFAFTEPSRG